MHAHGDCKLAVFEPAAPSLHSCWCELGIPGIKGIVQNLDSGLWTLDWTVDWTLDSIFGLQF